MNVKIKKLYGNSVIPKYAHSTDAGMDLYCARMEMRDGQIVYGTGIAVEIPDGYVGLVFPRSSVCKTKLRLTNSVGVIDSGYRGEITMVYDYKGINIYDIGDRVGQLIIMPYPKVEFEEVDELSDSDRGEKGYGSTGV